MRLAPHLLGQRAPLPVDDVHEQRDRLFGLLVLGQVIGLIVLGASLFGGVLAGFRLHPRFLVGRLAPRPNCSLARPSF